MPPTQSSSASQSQRHAAPPHTWRSPGWLVPSVGPATWWPRMVVVLATLGALAPGLAPSVSGRRSRMGLGVTELGAALLPLGAVACPGHADPLQLVLVHAAGVWVAGIAGALLAVPVVRWARGVEG